MHVMGMVDWRRPRIASVVGVVVFMLIEHVVNVLLFGRQQPANLVHNVFGRCDVQVDQRFQHLVAVLVLCHLQRQERVDVDQPQI